MLRRLPERVDPFRLAETGAREHGCIPLAGMRRLIPSLASEAGEVEADLAFGVDDMGTRFLLGTLKADVRLTCQRCLEPLQLHLESSFSLGLVRDQAEAEALGEAYEPLVVDRVPVQLVDLIEDELILSLPLVPMHEAALCPATPVLERSAAEEQRPQEPNPFAALAQLKKTGRDDSESE